jgi:site-specific recombinase XerD
VERGVDVKSVSELLGHADVRTTLRLYVHSSMDYKRRAVEGIGFLKGIT